MLEYFQQLSGSGIMIWMIVAVFMIVGGIYAIIEALLLLKDKTVLFLIRWKIDRDARERNERRGK